MRYGADLVVNGEPLDLDDEELFETYDEAYQHGLELLGAYNTGMGTLNMSNPGDYPLGDEPEVEVFGVNG